MLKELFETGKSVDVAIESACEKLGCSRDECKWEIIDLPKKGFLGLKNTPAKVRVSIEIPDEKPQIISSPQPPRTERKAVKPKDTKPQKTAVKEKSKAENSESRLHKKTAVNKAELLKAEEMSGQEKLALDYITDVVEAAGLKANYSITRENGGSCINIVGEGLGMIIGRRGETLDALQYLAGLVANRGNGDYVRITIDCGDYRSKRKGTLEALAKKLAGQVLKTNISKTLEPMNPFERRIIHATVSEIEGVMSASIGDEPNRRVVITTPTSKNAPRSGYRGDRDKFSKPGYNKNRGPRRDFRGEGGENENRDRRGGRDARKGGERPRQVQQASQDPPKKTPEAEVTNGVSIGKIDL